VGDEEVIHKRMELVLFVRFVAMPQLKKRFEKEPNYAQQEYDARPNGMRKILFDLKALFAASEVDRLRLGPYLKLVLCDQKRQILMSINSPNFPSRKLNQLEDL
tara:strand:- start:3911 stop:4222 length:312 start_codon:yes stop_codon:yes gene_type:complete